MNANPQDTTSFPTARNPYAIWLKICLWSGALAAVLVVASLLLPEEATGIVYFLITNGLAFVCLFFVPVLFFCTSYHRAFFSPDKIVAYWPGSTTPSRSCPRGRVWLAETALQRDSRYFDLKEVLNKVHGINLEVGKNGGLFISVKFSRVYPAGFGWFEIPIPGAFRPQAEAWVNYQRERLGLEH